MSQSAMVAETPLTYLFIFGYDRYGEYPYQRGWTVLTSSMSLKWCRKNLEKHSQAVFDLIREEYPDVEMEVSDCVDCSGLCTDVPFVLRNNAIVSARDPRGLYVKLQKGMSFLTKPPLPGTYAAVMAEMEKEASATQSTPNSSDE